MARVGGFRRVIARGLEKVIRLLAGIETSVEGSPERRTWCLMREEREH